MGETGDRMTFEERELESNQSEQPEEIRREIEQTRAEMSKTVDAIQERLDPERLRAQAQENIREATVGRASHMVDQAGNRVTRTRMNIVETVRQNPVPALLTGIGIGWLLLEGTGSDYPERYRQEYRSFQADMGPSGRHRESTVRDTVDEARSRVEDAADQAREQVGQLGGQAQYQTHQARSRMRRMVYENPMAVGAIAVAVGTAVGLALPETEQEHRLMGETRDELLDKAGSAAEDTVKRVQEVARESRDAAMEAAKEEAKKQDLQ